MSDTSDVPGDPQNKEDTVEFLVEFKLNVPPATPESEVEEGESDEASAAAMLVALESHPNDPAARARPVEPVEPQVSAGITPFDSRERLDGPVAGTATHNRG